MVNCDDLIAGSGEADSAEAFGLEGEDALLLTAIVPLLGTLPIILLVFCVLHKLLPSSYYANPLVRGYGPPRPSGSEHWFGLFNFLPRVVCMTDDELEEHMGLDALVMLIFIRTILLILTGFSLVGLLLIFGYMIAFFTADEDTQNEYPKGGLAKISLANVSVKDKAGGAWFALVLSVLACYGMTVWAVWCIRRSWRLVIRRRTAQLLDKANTDATSVLVLNPPTSAPMQKERVEQLWHELHPGNVLDVCMLLDTGKLPQLLPKHDKLRRRLEHLGKQDAKKRVGCCKRKVVSEELRKKEAELRAVDEQIRAEHDHVVDNEVGLNYVVLLRDLRACNVAKQVALGAEGASSVITAPLPADLNRIVLEPDIAKQVEAKRWVGLVIYWLVFCFYLVPIAFISFLISFERNEWLQDAVDSLGSQASALVQGLLPGLALIIFLAILPDICLLCASLAAPPSLSMTLRYAFIYLFRFNIVWNFIGVALGSNAFVIFSATECLVKETADMLTLIGSQLARNATFFMVFLSLQILLTLPLNELTLLVPIIKEKLLKAFGLMRPTEAPREPIKFHVYLSKVSFVATIGICYAVVSPVAVLFAWVYCAEAYVLHARNNLYFHSRRWEAHGIFWPAASDQLFIILVIGQVVLITTHLVLASVTAALLAPLPILTLIAWAKVNKAYVPHMHAIPLAKVVKADAEIHLASDDERIAAFQAAYRQPEFDLPDDLYTSSDGTAITVPQRTVAH